MEAISALAFDLDGTLYTGGKAIEGAVDAVARLRARGFGVRYLTNTTSRSRGEVAAKLRRLGFDAPDASVFSPPHAAGEFLRARGGSAHLAVVDAALADFVGVPREDTAPDFVVVGDLGDAWTFARLNGVFRKLQGGAELIALGRTRYWQTDAGLTLDVGPIVAALEYATGRPARVFGKPEPEFFEAVAVDLGVEPARLAVVGDDVVTDVRAAMRIGCTGVLVRTGKFRERDLADGSAPDLVCDSIADLPAALGI